MLWSGRDQLDAYTRCLRRVYYASTKRVGLESDGVMSSFVMSECIMSECVISEFCYETHVRL